MPFYFILPPQGPVRTGPETHSSCQSKASDTAFQEVPSTEMTRSMDHTESCPPPAYSFHLEWRKPQGRQETLTKCLPGIGHCTHTKILNLSFHWSHPQSIRGEILKSDLKYRIYQGNVTVGEIGVKEPRSFPQISH